MLAVTTIPASAFDYNITFTGSGASTTLDSVVVQNLSKGTQVTVHGGTQFQLTDVNSGINELNSIADLAFVYPNPTTGNATYTFTAKYAGNTQIAVCGLDGRKVAGLDADLQQGKNSVQLALPNGVYLVRAIGNGFSYTTKTISLSMTNSEPKITFSGHSNYTIPQRAPAPEVKLQYSNGDQLLYKGYSGNYCTIVTDKPTVSKTTNFKFVECADADGNHYAVVHIGTQTWMAENLKTTKYRNGETIPNVTNNASWASLTTGAMCDYNNVVANGSKYGHLYNWHAVTDSRNIAPNGWLLPTDAELTNMQNYLITNGYNFDGAISGNKIAKSLAATTDWFTSTFIGAIGNDLSRNNNSGFTVLPCGYRDNNGVFNSINEDGYLWSSTMGSTTDALSRNLKYIYSDLYGVSSPINYGFSIRCIRGELPNITTTAVTSVENTTAVTGGEIISEGTSAVTQRGVCWSISNNPTIDYGKTNDGSGAGLFTSNMTVLIPGITYYVRAYATTSAGTAYGNEVSFTTKQSSNESETVTDIDGNVYHSVTIGTQTWLVENLKTTRYRNGERIVTTTPVNKDIRYEDTPKYQWAYNGDEGNVAKYGRLYTWDVVIDCRNVAPEGWHVPTKSEWTILRDYLISNGYNYDCTISGNKIAKSLASTTYWDTSITVGAIGNDLSRNNSSGFTALPSGYRAEEGKFYDLNKGLHWWASDYYTNSTKNAYAYLLSNAYPNFFNPFGDRRNSGNSIRCVKDILPSLKTSTVTYIETTTAVCGGEIISEGNVAVAERGVCWSTNQNPTIVDNKTTDITKTFSSYMTGLLPVTTYYVRAYATTSGGTSYGNEVSFTTKQVVSDGAVTDIDGNVYHTITLGTQTWMVENLKTTRYRNGDEIGTTTPANKNIYSEPTPNYQWAYNGDEKYVAKYGRLYTWYAATDSRNIAPAGWHVPNDNEWTILQNYLIANGYNYDSTTTGNKIAKSLAATTDWVTNTSLGAIGNDLTKNNRSGFTALPSGRRANSETFMDFEDRSFWWSSTQNTTTYSWNRSLYNSSGSEYLARAYQNSKSDGYSVRCLRDY